MSTRPLLKASALLAGGNTAGRILSFAASILVARLLTPRQFGGFGLIQTTVGMFGILAGLSLGWMATHYVARFRTADPERARQVTVFVLGVGILTSASVAALLFGAAPALAGRALSNPELTLPLRVASVQLFVSSVFGILTGVLTGLERFGLNSIANVLQNLLILPATCLLAPFWGVTGALVAQIAGFTAGAAFALWHVMRFLAGFRMADLPAVIRRELRLVSDFCVPALACSFLIFPAMWLAQMILSRQPLGLEQVALFTAADRFRQLIIFLANFVSVAAFPMLSGMAPSEGARFGHTMELSLLMCSFWTLPVACGLALAGPFAMGMFGAAYRSRPEVFLSVLGWAVAAALSGMLATGLTAAGRMWLQVWQSLAYGGVVIAVTWLRRDAGALALAQANLAAAVVQLVWSCAWLLKNGRIHGRAAGILAADAVWIGAFCGAARLVPAGWGLALAPAAVTFTLSGLFVGVLNGRERRQVDREIVGPALAWLALAARVGVAR